MGTAGHSVKHWNKYKIIFLLHCAMGSTPECSLSFTPLQCALRRVILTERSTSAQRSHLMTVSNPYVLIYQGSRAVRIRY
jgi:hypothetical protein